MPRYIEEDAIRQGKFHINYLIPDGDKDDSYWYQCGWNGAIDTVLDCLPKVEAEPVVRCKDCKQFVRTNAIHDGECPKLQVFVNQDYYCWWGERREG